MKKICILMVMIFSLSGCDSTKTLVCKLNVQEQEYTTQVTYEYNKDGEILSLISYSEYYLNESDLKDFTLDEYYNDFSEGYKNDEGIDGLVIEITKDEKDNMIGESITLDTQTYDFESDLFGLGTKDDYSSIDDVLTMMEATDAFICE